MTKKNNLKRTTFFHLTLDIDNIIQEFTPRIPSEESALLCGEELETPRICITPSLEGCLSAVPWGGIVFEDIMEDYGHYLASKPIRVYEFDLSDIPQKNIITPDILYKNDWVRDAEFTQEHWVINQNLIPIRTYVIQVTDYYESLEDNISYEDVMHCKETGEDIVEYFNGVYTIINDVKYRVMDEEDIKQYKTAV